MILKGNTSAATLALLVAQFGIEVQSSHYTLLELYYKIVNVCFVCDSFVMSRLTNVQHRSEYLCNIKGTPKVLSCYAVFCPSTVDYFYFFFRDHLCFLILAPTK